MYWYKCDLAPEPGRDFTRLASHPISMRESERGSRLLLRHLAKFWVGSREMISDGSVPRLARHHRPEGAKGDSKGELVRRAGGLAHSRPSTNRRGRANYVWRRLCSERGCLNNLLIPRRSLKGCVCAFFPLTQSPSSDGRSLATRGQNFHLGTGVVHI